MSLLEQIKTDRIAAWKGKETVKLNLLTTLYSEAAMIGKNNGNRQSTDAEVISVLKKFIKNAQETAAHIAASIQLNKLAVVQQYADEIKWLNAYLPQQLDADQIKEKITQFVLTNPTAKMGDVMKYFKDNHEGQYDGKQVSTLVKELL
jgi:uncharacterized protein YqeY